MREITDAVILMAGDGFPPARLRRNVAEAARADLRAAAHLLRR